MDIDLEKLWVRRAVLERLRAEPAIGRQRKSISIARLLRHDFHFRNSRLVLFYISTGLEVDTRLLLADLLALNRRVAVPYIDREFGRLVPVEVKHPERELEPGNYGIWEPKNPRPAKDLHHLDCVLVPGLAFDRQGNRIGRGKGYYDRFLATLPSRVVRYGLAYDVQMFDTVPAAPGDVKVDRVFVNG